MMMMMMMDDLSVFLFDQLISTEILQVRPVSKLKVEVNFCKLLWQLAVH